MLKAEEKPKYNVIFTKTHGMFASQKVYASVDEMKKDFTDYLGHLDFYTLENLVEHMSWSNKMSDVKLAADLEPLKNGVESVKLS